MWDDTILMMRKQYNDLPHKPQARLKHNRLYEILEVLVEFFKAGGSGLSNKDIGTDEYADLLEDLTIVRMTTDEVIRTFLGDLVEQQVCMSCTTSLYGVLEFC